MSIDTIVALASPPGVGAISVLRISGPAAQKSLRQLLHAEKDAEVFSPRRAYLRKLHDEIFLDKVLFIFFESPHSFSGEEMVEIYCHGGELVAGRIIEALLRHGCRLATAGEFTRRAVENGKLDLLQAEAIADLISAESGSAADNALRQLDGELSSKISALREQLIRIAAVLELELDFAEEDVSFADRHDIDEQLFNIAARIEHLVDTYEKGRGLRRGIRVAIVGKPNVGKSSLLNAIVGSERAIVSAQPGTTRDFIEESVRLDGLSFRFIDTAGIRHPREEIEHEGIERTRRRIADADMLLLVVDGAKPLDELDAEILRECLQAVAVDRRKKIIIVKNKTDLGDGASIPDTFEASAQIGISVARMQGIDLLLRQTVAVAKKFFDAEQQEVFITNLRQKHALEKSIEYLGHALTSSKSRLSGEFIARDLRAAAAELAGLIGEITSEQILDELFARFCIGK